MNDQIVSRVVSVSRNARDYAIVASEPDPKIRTWLTERLCLDIAREIASAPTATQHPARPVKIDGLYGSISLALGDREIVVVCNLLTRSGRVTLDERTGS